MNCVPYNHNPLIIMAKIVINNKGVNKDPIRSTILPGLIHKYKTTIK